MKYILLVLLSSICFSASAQWWQKPLNIFKKNERFPLLTSLNDNSVTRLPGVIITKCKVVPVVVEHGSYITTIEEEAMIRTAQHNMRFRMYNLASYNFSDLAQMYLKENRLSEAKWYLLQSIQISRQQSDDKHTITNLMGLATVKVGYGDYLQAVQDLNEALNLANLRGMLTDVASINKQMRFLQENKDSPKAEIRYAETAGLDPKQANK